MVENHKNTFREIIEMIPQLIKAGKVCIEREIENQHHSLERMRAELNMMKNTTALFEGKWTLEILYSLGIGKELYYNDLKRLHTGIGSRILTDRLKFLETQKIISRKVHSTQPIRVSYKITRFGMDLIYLALPIFFYYNYFQKD
jgi:DNA-binding HxlR family transcriptional regulator